MKITIDGMLAVVTPDQVNWQPPQVLARDGGRAPINAPYWKCRLALSRVTEVKHSDWFSLRDSQTHTFSLPHPSTGVMTIFTGYVDSVAGRFDVRRNCAAAMAGMDIQLSGILVSI